jgi:hypothetical protein
VADFAACEAQRTRHVLVMLPGASVASDEVSATLQDWVSEVEWAHLIVRLSPRLRQRHGD